VRVNAGTDGTSETLGWIGALTGLAARHALLVAEMQLRGYFDRTPLAAPRGPTS
jgi:hypothetical protein